MFFLNCYWWRRSCNHQDIFNRKIFLLFEVINSEKLAKNLHHHNYSEGQVWVTLEKKISISHPRPVPVESNRVLCFLDLAVFKVSRTISLQRSLRVQFLNIIPVSLSSRPQYGKILSLDRPYARPD